MSPSSAQHGSRVPSAHLFQVFLSNCCLGSGVRGRQRSAAARAPSDRPSADAPPAGVRAGRSRRHRRCPPLWTCNVRAAKWRTGAVLRRDHPLGQRLEPPRALRQKEVARAAGSRTCTALPGDRARQTHAVEPVWQSGRGERSSVTPRSAVGRRDRWLRVPVVCRPGPSPDPSAAQPAREHPRSRPQGRGCRLDLTRVATISPPGVSGTRSRCRRRGSSGRAQGEGHQAAPGVKRYASDRFDQPSSTRRDLVLNLAKRTTTGPESTE